MTNRIIEPAEVPERLRALRSLGFGVRCTENFESFHGRGEATVTLMRPPLINNIQFKLSARYYHEWLHGHDVEGYAMSWSLLVLDGEPNEELVEDTRRYLRVIGITDPNRSIDDLMGLEAPPTPPPADRRALPTNWAPYRPSHTVQTPHGSVRRAARYGGRSMGYEEQLRQAISQLLPQAAYSNRGTTEPTDQEIADALVPGVDVQEVNVSRDANNPERMNVDMRVRLPHAADYVAIDFAVPPDGAQPRTLRGPSFTVGEHPHSVNQDTLEHEARAMKKKQAEEEEAARRFKPGRILDLD